MNFVGKIPSVVFSSTHRRKFPRVCRRFRTVVVVVAAAAAATATDVVGNDGKLFSRRTPSALTAESLFTAAAAARRW